MIEKNIMITEKIHRKVRKISDETGIKMKMLVNNLIEEGLNATHATDGTNRVPRKSGRKASNPKLGGQI